MKTLSLFNSTRTLCLLLLAFILNGCSQENSIPIRGINITLNQTSAWVNLDEIEIEAKVFDEAGDPIEGLEVSYFLGNTELGAKTFIPEEVGTQDVYVIFQGQESNRIPLTVFDPSEPLDQLTLDYQGYRQLTTNPWSISGGFHLCGQKGTTRIDVPQSLYRLTLEGEPTDLFSGFQFDSPGKRSIKAIMNGIESNAIELEVREEKSYEPYTIPVIFHAYGIELNSGQINAMIDTLNGGFNPAPFTKAQVASEQVSPNAVNMNIRFVAATDPPEGKNLDLPGLNTVAGENPFPPLLNNTSFPDLENLHNWDPDTYINIWVTASEGWDITQGFENGTNFGLRGLANSPILKTKELVGLQTGYNPAGRNQIDPESLSNSIVVIGLSVFDEHPDFVLRNVGIFLGLFETIAYDGCASDPDYCADTFSRDFNADTGFNPRALSCSEVFFFPRNHMSSGGIYTHFSYDQRERIRKVLGEAYFRP